MYKRVRYSLLVGLLLFVIPMRGQTFNPSNPPEPTAPEAPSISLFLKSVPEGAGSLTGAGKYKNKTKVSISAKPNSSYVFLYWADSEGNVLSETSTYEHIKGPREETLVAHFKFSPANPSEPTKPNVKPMHKVSVSATKGGSASAAAAKVREGESVNLTATAQSGYLFEAWYLGDTLYMSNKASYSYKMDTFDVHFVARFKEIEPEEEPPFNPSSPAEPSRPDVKPMHKVSVSASLGGTASAGASKVREGETVSLTATAQSGYLFEAWYLGDTLYMSNKTSYSYKMDTFDVHFVARFKEIEPEEEPPFNPSSPSEPSSPVVTEHSIFLMSMTAKPGDTTYCEVYVNVVKPLVEMSFQLNFPSGSNPVPNDIDWSKKINTSSANTALLSDSVMSVTIEGDTINKGSFRLMRFAVYVNPDFLAGTNNLVSCNQVSLLHDTGESGTCSTRNSNLKVYKFGDADNSGVLDVFDLVMARDFLYGMSLNNFEPIAVDLNRNGKVDELDIQMMIQLIMEN